MPLILRCDSCGKEGHIGRMGAIGRPHLDGWWILPARDTVIVACCADHALAVQADRDGRGASQRADAGASADPAA